MASRLATPVTLGFRHPWLNGDGFFPDAEACPGRAGRFFTTEATEVRGGTDRRKSGDGSLTIQHEGAKARRKLMCTRALRERVESRIPMRWSSSIEDFGIHAFNGDRSDQRPKMSAPYSYTLFPDSL